LELNSPHLFLQNFALVLGVAAVTTVVSRRLKLPGVFGYLVAGMIVGPHTPFPMVADLLTIRALAELGVVLLMFSLGLEFHLGRLLKVGAATGVAALTETSLMFGLGYAAAWLLDWEPGERVFTGAIVAISSTTIIARVFAEQRVERRVRDTVFGILIAEDLIAILLVAGLSAASGSAESEPAFLLTGVRLATFLIALVTVGRWVVPRIVHLVVALQSPETMTVFAVGLAFAAAYLALTLGYSVALGSFLAGSLVAESGEGERVERLIAPVRDILVAVFFVAVGMLFEPAAVREHWAAVLVLTLLVIIGKVFAVSLGAFLTGRGLPTSLQTGMSLAQIGEFSFIIAGVGLTLGATRPFLYPVAIAVSALTTLTTPPLVRRSARAAQAIDRRLPRSLQTFVALYGSWVGGLASTVADPAARGIRTAAWWLVADVALLGGLILGAAAEMGRLAIFIETRLGWDAATARWAVVGLAIAASTPFVAGIVRVTRTLSVRLAGRSLPEPQRRGLDPAAAPRRAFVATVQYGLLIACAIPLLALLQPLAPNVPIIPLAGLLGLAAAVAVWRSATVLYSHARAGAEVIVMALTQHARAEGSPSELARTMEHLTAMLPGLGTPALAKLGPRDGAVEKTLGELDLRGATGATVLAILRRRDHGDVDSAHESIAPSGEERLRDGDILVLAGTGEAVTAARRLLQAARADDEGPS
jgi:CPA2 family monovalent cation:H+ antiporter-2